MKEDSGGVVQNGKIEKLHVKTVAVFSQRSGPLSWRSVPYNVPSRSVTGALEWYRLHVGPDRADPISVKFYTKVSCHFLLTVEGRQVGMYASQEIDYSPRFFFSPKILTRHQVEELDPEYAEKMRRKRLKYAIHAGHQWFIACRGVTVRKKYVIVAETFDLYDRPLSFL